MSITIASLALLKARYDIARSDVLDGLRPFISYLISKRQLSRFSTALIKAALVDEFSLSIPTHTVELLLRRMSRDGHLSRENHAYTIVDVPNNVEEFEQLRASAIQHQSATEAGLVRHAKEILQLELTKEDAEAALHDYIDQYSIDCIKAYSTGSVVPVHGRSPKHWQYIVSSYVNTISTEDPEKFKYMVTVVMGRMLSNALLGEDLTSIQMNFVGTTTYLDTPIVLQVLGVLGDAPQLLADEILALLTKSKAKIAVFEHDIREVENVLKHAEHHLRSYTSGGTDVVINLREVGYSPSDVLMLRSTIRERLKDKGIDIVETPPYIETLQIDEAALEQEMTTAGLLYRAEAPKRFDINSIRSIYVLRNGRSSKRVEDCKAIFVTTNSALARAAYAYGWRHEESQDVSTVITDFSLTNLIWLKSPAGDLDTPRKMMAVNCYAALRPSDAFWTAFLSQIEKLQKERRVTATQHQYLRYEAKVRIDLMNMTLGDESSLSDQQVLQILDRHEQSLTRPFKDRVENLEAAEKDAASRATELQSRLDLIDARVKDLGKFARYVVAAAMVLIAATLLALAHGWIGSEFTNGLGDTMKWVVRIGVYIADLYLLAHAIFHYSVWNPISRIAMRLERSIVDNARKYLGLADNNIVPTQVPANNKTSTAASHPRTPSD